MLFDELSDLKKMEDPEIRQAAELKRATAKTKRGRKSSVSFGTLRASLIIIGTILSLGALSGVGWLVWQAIKIYTGN